MSPYLPGHSYLRPEPISPDLLQALQVETIDLIEADLDQLSLKEVRALIATAVTKPYGTHRLLWLRAAEQVSEATQNTLLKLLEEPPRTLIIIVQATSVDRFLPTIQSRLHRTVTSYWAQPADDQPSYRTLAEFETALRTSDRAGTRQLITKELAYQARQFRSQPTPPAAQAIKLLEKSLLWLDQNANAKLVIDVLVLRYPLRSGRA